MHEQIIRYLNDNKDKYPKESLVNELSKVGYSERSILESVQAVYGRAEVVNGGKTSFWNFKDKKEYRKASEKAGDVFLGFLFPWVFGWAISMAVHTLLAPFGMMFFIWLLGVILYIFALVYFYRKRRYIFYGMLLNIIIPLFGVFFMVF